MKSNPRPHVPVFDIHLLIRTEVPFAWVLSIMFVKDRHFSMTETVCWPSHSSVFRRCVYISKLVELLRILEHKFVWC
jgi:hypothetical protein